MIKWPAVFCNPLPKVMNGTWGPSKCPQAKIRYGEHCNATCATGFELRGPAVRRCSELGAWTEEEVKVSLFNYFDYFFQIFPLN